MSDLLARTLVGTVPMSDFSADLTVQVHAFPNMGTTAIKQFDSADQINVIVLDKDQLERFAALINQAINLHNGNRE